MLECDHLLIIEPEDENDIREGVFFVDKDIIVEIPLGALVVEDFRKYLVSWFAPNLKNKSALVVSLQVGIHYFKLEDRVVRSINAWWIVMAKALYSELRLAYKQ